LYHPTKNKNKNKNKNKTTNNQMNSDSDDRTKRFIGRENARGDKSEHTLGLLRRHPGRIPGE
jgi:hypothetical protein